MPLGKSASANIRKLYEEHEGEKDWPRARIIAAGMNAARKASGKVRPLQKARLLPTGKRKVKKP